MIVENANFHIFQFCSFFEKMSDLEKFKNFANNESKITYMKIIRFYKWTFQSSILSKSSSFINKNFTYLT